ncbi:MspA family porin [Nocardia sp. SYP-A9097]|uniref:MspA family porin n=1 Tax=Nocardia sp. SYP-A9097 TaxID=2663237 RepID=UPI00189142AB|nr:MspA family porin [Nocardia sp. SYP-A9097]
MITKTVIAGMLTAVGLVLGSGDAQAAALAPHEKTTVAPNGMSITVGHQDNAVNPVAPMNFMRTSRQVYVDNTSYGRVDGGTGKIRTGVFVACAVDLDVKFTVSASAGVDLDASAGIGIGTTGVTPSASVDISPKIGGSVGFTLAITPGKIADIKLGEKQIPPGGTGYIVTRDYRITADGCGGPLTVQAYTIIEATSSEVDAADWVMGDPVVM